MKNAIIDFQSGKSIDLLNPMSSDIDIIDIAKGLSYKGHFGGHTPKYFSIAEHCLLVSQVTNDLYGLLHDASEAYICDIPRPLKKHLLKYKKIEELFMRAISRKFRLNYNTFDSRYIHLADEDVLMLECTTFLPNAKNPPKIKYNNHPELRINYFPPEYAMERFLERFFDLTE